MYLIHGLVIFYYVALRPDLKTTQLINLELQCVNNNNYFHSAKQTVTSSKASPQPTLIQGPQRREFKY